MSLRDFLDEEYRSSWREWSYDFRSGSIEGFYIGNGSPALEVAVGRSSSTPTKKELTNIWNERKGWRAAPVLVVLLHGDGASVCGPTAGSSGGSPPLRKSIDQDQVKRISEEALDKPNRNVARQFLWNVIQQIDDELIGVRNQGLVSVHELKTGVKQRSDWESANRKSKQLLGIEGRNLIEQLGYEVERLDSGKEYILKDGHRNSAVAVFLEEGEDFEITQERFEDDTPINYALNKAEEEVDVEYVVASAGKTLRLYTTDPDKGLGSRGRTDTFVEINSALLPEEDAGYLSLMFSPESLREGGSLEKIIENSEDYAANLGRRLRSRIYDRVVPDLAEAIAESRNLENPSRKELDKTYEMSIILLYRLLFIAYAEDEGYLPRKRNEMYKKRSLKEKAKELNKIIQDGDQEFDSSSSSHWRDIERLAEAIQKGQTEWGLPRYDGRLLSSNPEVSEAGAELANLELSNDVFGPVLAKLLIDETREGFQGPVDFRNLGVREFGVIYQGLLESELSMAEQSLGIEEKNGVEQYIPVDNSEKAEVEKGEIYLHGTSGERKATGTYYTKSIFVEHLLDHALEPAIEEHLEELDEMSDAEAAENFFNFKVADIAMGSGHFLVGAVDRIESRFSGYLAKRPLPGIEEELDKLREAAREAFYNEEDAPDIERSQLLRRQIARRCIYGVDLNSLATELARLSIWIHTFVPGLPLTFLNHNLVVGDSLSGIGTLREAEEILEIKEKTLFAYLGKDDVNHMEEVREEVEKLGDITESDAQEVVEARKTQEKIESHLEGYKALFDILSASRITDEIDLDKIRNKNIDSIKETDEYRVAKENLSLTDPLHFPIVFPEIFGKNNPGFDVIVGNPPWEKTKIERHEFWGRFYPGLRGLSQTKMEREIEKLEDERPDLVEVLEKKKKEEKQRSKILTNGPYPGIGGSDPDLHVGFVWRFWNLAKENGNIGAVIPRSVFIGPSTKDYRETLINDSKILDLTYLKNKGNWVFEGTESRYTIVLNAIDKSAKNKDYLPLRGPYPSLEIYKNREDPVEFDIDMAEEWIDTAFPILPLHPKSSEVLKKLSAKPKLDFSGSWDVEFATELHASQDKTKDDGTKLMHFTNEPKNDYWPVFKGASFDLWNPDTGIVYAWAEPDIMLDYLYKSRKSSYGHWNSPFTNMKKNWVEDKKTLPCLHPSVAYREVTNRTNSRTLIAALVPPETFLTHKAWYAIWPKGDFRDKSYLLGILSSIPFDWYARRFIEETASKSLVKSFPVPRPGRDSELRKRVEKIAAQLSSIDERYSEFSNKMDVEVGDLQEKQKRQMIRELDAIVARLYDLKEEQLRIIFESFHEVSNEPDYWEEKKRDTLQFFDDIGGDNSG